MENNNDRSSTFPTVPRNYQQLLRIETPTENEIGEIYEEDLFITFEAFPPPSIRYLSTFLKGATSPYTFNQSSTLGGYRFLHPNQEISERITHAYNADSSTYASAVNNIMDKGVSVVNAWKQIMNDSTEGAVYDAPVIWASSERREFNIVLNLFAYNDVEEDIYGPIRFFRKHSYPTKNGVGVGVLGTSTGKRLGTITYPSVFKISGGAFDTLNANQSINFFNLTNMSVNFNDTIKFMRRGTPMQAKLSLTFQECLKMYSNWLDDSKMTINVDEKINNIVLPTGRRDITSRFRANRAITQMGKLGELKRPNTKALKEKITEQAIKFALQKIQSTAVVRAVSNLKQRAINEAIYYALRKIQGSGTYKKIDDALNIDPMHRIEMRKYTHAGFKRSDTIEPAHEAEVDNILKKSRG